MRLELLLPSEIAANWGRLGSLLAPAIAWDEQRQEADVYRDLMAGDMALIEVDSSTAKGVAVIEIRDRCCWVLYAAGYADGAPRCWMDRVRVLMSYLIGLARAHDCTEMRVEGRDWSRVFPDWERLGGRNELRRAI